MNLKVIVQAFQELEDRRNISQEFVSEALEESLVKAYRREIGVPDAIIEVDINQDSGEIKLFHNFLVVENVEDDELEVSKEELGSKGEGLEIGDYYKIEKPVNELGRAAVTLAKNVIKQKIREAEKLAIYNEYYRQLDEMVMAKIETVEDKYIVLDLGKALAIMPRSAQMPNEYYQEGQTIKVVITEVNKESKGAQILASRATDMLVRRLFEREVPEFSTNAVEIKAMAREAGDRTKVAVHSNDPDIDPIGAFIGHQGARINAVKNELKGENIDIFEWSDNMIDLVKNALSPAEVVAVFENPEHNGLMVVVEDDQLSLAIGKRGKNARLAVRLTKERIDIKSISEALEKDIDYIALMAEYEAKLRKEAIEEVKVEEIAEVETVIEGEVETDEEIVEDIGVDTEPVEEVVETTKEVAEPVHKSVEKESVVIPEKTQRKRPLLKPRTDEFVSKFEEIADASRANEDEDHSYRRRRRPEKQQEVVSTAELLETLEYEIQPEYTQEDLEEIEARDEAYESEWYDEDIDFDEFEDYYE